jgi:hypothetical protein
MILAAFPAIKELINDCREQPKRKFLYPVRIEYGQKALLFYLKIDSFRFRFS